MEREIANPLSQPVGAVMRPAARVAPEDSIRVAGARLRESGVGIVAVTDGDVFVGAIDETQLARSLGDAVDLDDACAPLATAWPKVKPYESGAAALRAFADGASVLVVTDDQDRVMGVVTASDLLPRKRPMLKPPAVGGMATPFGVYLTTGTVRAGAPAYGLVATGSLLFTLLFVAQEVGFRIGELVARDAPAWFQGVLGNVLPLALFFLGMRLLPLSGTHAAEHQVVHAIERGEELVPSIVRRMPRVHPRCGTNLAAGLSLFLGLSSASFIPWPELRIVIALLVTVFAWRPLGSLLQYWVTTRPANDRQLASGIFAGRQLLERYQATRVAVPSIPMRIWNSGMLHVISGSLLMYGVIAGLSALFGWDVGL